MSNSIPEQLRFLTIDGLTVRADFGSGALSSDLGPLLLSGVDRQIGLILRLHKIPFTRASRWLANNNIPIAEIRQPSVSEIKL